MLKMFCLFQKLRKKIKSCVLNKADFQEFLPYADVFEKNIIGVVPI